MSGSKSIIYLCSSSKNLICLSRICSFLEDNTLYNSGFIVASILGYIFRYFCVLYLNQFFINLNIFKYTFNILYERKKFY